MKASPDETKVLKSDYCQCCGADITALEHLLVSKRQEVVLPPIEAKFVEYQQYGCLCSCGHHQKADYPSNVVASIQFCSEIVSLVSYFNIFQYVPYRRVKLLFKDVFNLSISEGSIANLLNKTAKKSKPVYEAILENIKAASYLGSDETGAKVNGHKWWIWVWQTAKDTFLKASESRGFKTIEEVFSEGLPHAIIGSDQWAAELKINSKSKQLYFRNIKTKLQHISSGLR